MFAGWPFSGRKDTVPPIPMSIDSGYGSMASLTDSGPGRTAPEGLTGQADRPGPSYISRSLKIVAKKIPKEHLETLKGFRLTFGGPLITHVRSRPALKGQHQAVFIEMKYVGEDEADARLTIIISCHWAYEKVVNAFLRSHREAIESFFDPGDADTGIYDKIAYDPKAKVDRIHITVFPLPPTALSKILCQRPDRSCDGLQLVGERLSYQSSEGVFQEATFGGFVGVSYDVGRWAVFGLTTAHQAHWALDEGETYSVAAHLSHIDALLAEALEDACSDTLAHFANTLTGLRSTLNQWTKFEFEPVEGIQSGEYSESRQRYVSSAKPILNEVMPLVDKISQYRESVDGRSENEVDADQRSAIINDMEEFEDKIMNFLRRQGSQLGHYEKPSIIDSYKQDEENWRTASSGNFESVESAWRDVHNSVMSDDLTGAGDVVAQSTDGPLKDSFTNFDWALIRIPELDKKLAAAIAAPGARKLGVMCAGETAVRREDPTENVVLLNAAHQFPDMTYSEETSYLCIPPSRDFAEVYQLHKGRFSQRKLNIIPFSRPFA
jgi:hypothetical protein